MLFVLDYLHVQTLMLTDFQTPFLGTPLRSLIELMVPSRVGSRRAGAVELRTRYLGSHALLRSLCRLQSPPPRNLLPPPYHPPPSPSLNSALPLNQRPRYARTRSVEGAFHNNSGGWARRRCRRPPSTRRLPRLWRASSTRPPHFQRRPRS